MATTSWLRTSTGPWEAPPPAGWDGAPWWPWPAPLPPHNILRLGKAEKGLLLLVPKACASRIPSESPLPGTHKLAFHTAFGEEGIRGSHDFFLRLQARITGSWHKAGEGLVRMEMCCPSTAGRGISMGE